VRFLLGTNIVSDLVRAPSGRVAIEVRRVGEGQVCTSIVVAAEIRYGAAKRGSPRLTAKLEGVLERLDVLPSSRRPTPLTASCAPVLSAWDGSSGPATCSSRPRRWRSDARS
jgi:predicted nucleic acid-binding protein